jgi:hypothetical protein
MRKKKDNFDKYNFSKTINKNISGNSFQTKQNIFETIKIWIFGVFQFLIYQWKHNRMIFLLVLSLLFILGYYIYTNYIKKDDIDNKKNEQNELLNNLVKNDNLKLKSKSKKKRIPKKHETRCRIIMENLFKASFISVRPDFLKYDKTGKNLELDVFNSDLMIALEYDGIHHRKFTEFFHKSEQDFIEQQERDKFKEEKCKELGIVLIRVPDTVKYEDLEDYIKEELDKRGIFYFK